MRLKKKDLKHIGNEAFKNESGNLSIICETETANIEFILLREILKLTGNKILSESDYIAGIINSKQEFYKIEFKTNYKYHKYLKLF